MSMSEPEARGPGEDEPAVMSGAFLARSLPRDAMFNFAGHRLITFARPD